MLKSQRKLHRCCQAPLLPNAYSWAQVPSEVKLTVCQALSVRNLKELKDRVRVSAKYISCRLESLPEGSFPKRHHSTQALDKLSWLENME